MVEEPETEGASRTLERHPSDLVFVDLHMPDTEVPDLIGSTGTRTSVGLIIGQDNAIVFDEDSVLERLSHDRELFVETVGTFLKEALPVLEGIKQAIACGDSTAIEILGHSMKGMAANFEALDLVAEARRLELLGHDEDLPGAREALADFERELTRLVHALEKTIQ